ncbi:hypothetical protein CEXT_239111 [Caerostris extrusa]|uniref:Uncharacterized protein n=1 Tax=Caerostris extrusa TaxID=172846 RepID=A0AAV4U844_CAEEX|nr:hypothetical protein CEXT_239111 [Caerostris extrusa]
MVRLWFTEQCLRFCKPKALLNVNTGIETAAILCGGRHKRERSSVSLPGTRRSHVPFCSERMQEKAPRCFPRACLFFLSGRAYFVSPVFNLV